MKKIPPEKIGYYGRPITALSKAELLDALSDLVTVIHNCSQKHEACKEAFRAYGHFESDKLD